MKLVIAVVQDQDAPLLLDKLAEDKIRATKLASTGGFLRQGNTTLLIGVNENMVDNVVDLIRETCSSKEQLITPIVSDFSRSVPDFMPQPITVKVGGATIFVLDVDRFEKV
ncbi:MAG: cyclic-di-AMP receptor [Firmicutes bacterium]|nr:cyclic-di-AMP receptor [Bacillota bacterium]MDD4264247.1 cyclic-di-AMP receptor [Bacillota bacterium]MDD4694192.1 cyclic-di-AMP receptor [Bacillota bacterium]